MSERSKIQHVNKKALEWLEAVFLCKTKLDVGLAYPVPTYVVVINITNYICENIVSLL